MIDVTSDSPADRSRHDRLETDRNRQTHERERRQHAARDGNRREQHSVAESTNGIT